MKDRLRSTEQTAAELLNAADELHERKVVGVTRGRATAMEIAAVMAMLGGV